MKRLTIAAKKRKDAADICFKIKLIIKNFEYNIDTEQKDYIGQIKIIKRMLIAISPAAHFYHK